MRAAAAPGTTEAMEFGREGYTPRQLAMWQALDTLYHAACFHRLHTLQPTPGQSYDAAKVEHRIQQVLDRWGAESMREPTESMREPDVRGIHREDIPMSVWLWLCERLEAAK